MDHVFCAYKFFYSFAKSDLGFEVIAVHKARQTDPTCGRSRCALRTG